MPNLRNRRLSRLALVSTFFLVMAAGPPLYAATVLEEEDAFVSLAEDVFVHPEIRRAVAEEATAATIEVISTDETITNGLPEELRTFTVPITQIAATQLTDAAFRLLDTAPATDARSAALRDVHRQFTANDDRIEIDLRSVIVRTSREIGGPAAGAAVAKLLVDSDVGQFTLAERGSSRSALITAVQTIPQVGVGLGLAALLTLILGIVAAPDRRRALINGGAVVAGASVLSTVLVAVLLAIAAGVTATGTGVPLAIAEVISADYAQHQSGVVLNGLVLAAVGLLAGQSATALALRSLPGDLWFWRVDGWSNVSAALADNPAAARLIGWALPAYALLSWSTPTWRVVATIAILTGAFQAMVWALSSPSTQANEIRRRLGTSEPARRDQPSHPLEQRLRVNLAILLTLAFLFWPAWRVQTAATFLIVGFLSQAALEIRPARANGEATTETIDSPQPQRWSRWGFAVAGIFAAVVIGAFASSSSIDRTELVSGCNGSLELCDRRIDEVVFAGSHNAMSSNDLGWDLAMQDGDMVTQLDHGVRALLIDALYWQSDGTLDGGSQGSSATVEAALSDDEPQPGAWLCHGFCALGATDLTAGLASIDNWLVENPREVLVIIVQDEISFEDLEAAFEASGLRDRAFVQQPNTAFPTLGELIDSGQQILVFGENGGQTGTWFQNGYADTFAETPFTFDVRSDFNCEPNRGDDTNPLLLINHWITTGIPVREAAAGINSREVLLERVEECQQTRGRRPTIIAVDFVETGDLIDVVDELNGTPAS